jgi:hypothetical protein
MVRKQGGGAGMMDRELGGANLGGNEQGAAVFPPMVRNMARGAPRTRLRMPGWPPRWPPRHAIGRRLRASGMGSAMGSAGAAAIVACVVAGALACAAPPSRPAESGAGSGARPGPPTAGQAECSSAQSLGTPQPGETYRNQFERRNQQVRGTLYNVRNQRVAGARMEFVVQDQRGAPRGGPQRITTTNIAPCGQWDYDLTLNTAVPPGGQVVATVTLQR